jgi:hypothetical protein
MCLWAVLISLKKSEPKVMIYIDVFLNKDQRSTSSVWKFDGNKKFRGKQIRRILQNSEKFGEIWENSTEMHLMSERNMNFLKTQKSAELANNSAEWTVNL